MNEEGSYFTIDKPSEGSYKEKGSKFLGFLFPASTEEEAKIHLEKIKSEHHKSRHVCYAWRIGSETPSEFSTDAGEPAHTAGPPILKQLQKYDLKNVLLIVARYYGGTKLGVGGLINAYRTAAEDTIANANIFPAYETANITITVSYEHVNQVMKTIKDFDLEIKEQDFAQECRLVISFRKTLEEKLLALISSISTAQVSS